MNTALMMPYYVDGKHVTFAEWQAYMRQIEREDIDPHAHNEFLSRGVPVDLDRVKDSVAA